MYVHAPDNYYNDDDESGESVEWTSEITANWMNGQKTLQLKIFKNSKILIAKAGIHKLWTK